MKWKTLPTQCKAYVLLIYVASVPFALLSLSHQPDFTATWFLFTIASFFVASINLHLPQTPSVVVSMGDVFTVLALIHFGPGQALITYWANVVATAVTKTIRRQGFHFLKKIVLHRLLFNISCCALSIWAMSSTYDFAHTLPLSDPLRVVIGLGSMALVWFLVNTGTLSAAVALSSGGSFWNVWREGLGLLLLNYFGSASAAGLISLFLESAGLSIFLLSLPVAVVFYWMFVFYIERYQQAQKHISELSKLYLQTIEAMANAVDAKDGYTHGHIRRVEALTSELAKFMGVVDERELMAIKAGALLHDIGKIAIPEYILNKPSALTETEYEKMKSHPSIGATILEKIDFPYPVLPLVRSHHERWDGNGYPDALKGDEIPLNARILALADCYDALTTQRPYRKPMPRAQLIELFRKESGRAYDPRVVETLIANIDAIDLAGSAVAAGPIHAWGLQQRQPVQATRQLERSEPTLTYSRALDSNLAVQKDLYSVFEFARADIHCFNTKDVLTFMSSKLSDLVAFDAGVFYLANLTEGVITARHVSGSVTLGLSNLSLPLEQKLTGWVAANNQSLSNLAPTPDFANCPEPRPEFQMSAIAPMNRDGVVVGAIALYRSTPTKFTDDEFRRLEIVASQTSIALSKHSEEECETEILVDSITRIPNSVQLYLMFDQIAMDAARYEYPISLLLIHLDDVDSIRRQWGYMSGDAAIAATADYLRKQLRETDFLVRYSANEFIAVNPRINRLQAETLKSRLQNDLDHLKFMVRIATEVSLRVSIGIAVFPDDGKAIESLFSTAEWQMREDLDLRSATQRRILRFPSPE